MSGQKRGALRTATAALALCVGGALLLSSCSNAGASLAHQACVHIARSIHLYSQAEHATATAAQAKASEAAGQLEKALPLAAQANSADPAYNPLMTTLQEIGRTSEANLIPALRAQCAAANNPTASPFSGTAGSTLPSGPSRTSG